MSLQSHLAELERRHQALETEIADEIHHASADPVHVTELKRRKLLLKDEIIRLKQEMQVATAH